MKVGDLVEVLFCGRTEEDFWRAEMYDTIGKKYHVKKAEGTNDSGTHLVQLDNNKWYNPSTLCIVKAAPIKQEKENIMNSYELEARALVQNRKYIVGSFDAYGNFSIVSRPSGHSTEEKAKTEAKRLSGLNGEKTFVVMQMKAGFKSVQIQEI